MSTSTLSRLSSEKSGDRGAYVYISVFSAVLYTVLLTAPVVAGKLAEQFALAPVQIGLLFSSELGAFSLASIPAYLWLRKTDVRVMTIAFGIVVVCGNIVSGFLTEYPLLLAARVITSFAAGSITVVILALGGRTANPSRAFGLFVVFQLAMGAAILAIFPLIYAGSGVGAIYWTLAGLTALSLPAAFLISGDVLKVAPGASKGGVVKTASLLYVGAGLAAILLFYVALSGVWSFMANLASQSGIELSQSSVVLSIATVAGILSAFVATVLGESERRKTYLRAGFAGMAIGIALLYGHIGLIRFAVAAIIFKFAWTLILPYLLSTVSALGGSQTMNTTNLMIGTGFAIGPIVSGAIIEAVGTNAMILFSFSAILLSTGCVLYAQRGEKYLQPHQLP